MITSFNSKTIYLGYDLTRFNEIRDYLDIQNIKYKYYVKNRLAEPTGRGTIRGHFVDIDSSSEFMYEYTIIIKKVMLSI